jgi:hypothetical protein
MEVFPKAYPEDFVVRRSAAASQDRAARVKRGSVVEVLLIHHRVSRAFAIVYDRYPVYITEVFETKEVDETTFAGVVSVMPPRGLVRKLSTGDRVVFGLIHINQIFMY